MWRKNVVYPLTSVSLVLNKRPHAISARTQQNIVDAAKRLNYNQPGWAVGNGRSTWKTLTVLFNNVQAQIMTNPYAAGILSGVFPIAAQAGYQIVVLTTTWEYTKGLIPAFRDGCTQGVLIVAPQVNSTIVSGLARTGLPIVVVSATTNVRRVVSLDVDNHLIAQLAVEHLLSLGHRRIGMIMGPLIEQSVLERQEGFRDTLSQAGIVPLPEYFVARASTMQEPTANTDSSRILTLPEPPTALFCSCDGIAGSVYEAAQRIWGFVFPTSYPWSPVTIIRVRPR